MTQNKELQVSITLGESSWRAIEDLLYHACQLRGRDWIRRQREMTEVVSESPQTPQSPQTPRKLQVVAGPQTTFRLGNQCTGSPFS